MATIASVPAPVKPSTPADPWAEPPRYAVPVADLTFGARICHVTRPGVWKIVRAAERRDSTSRYTIRARQFAEDGSLTGPVQSWRVDEVAGLATDAVEAAVEAPAPVPVADEPRPLVVAMVISIDHVHYAVSPLAPAPGATKAYRFQKVGGDLSQHDLDETADGASCTCGDFVWRHEGLAGLGCKHIRAARMCGLIADLPAARGPGEHDDPRDAYNTAREAEEAARRLDHVRDIGAGDTLDPRTFDADLDAEADDAPASWDDAATWVATEDDADPADLAAAWEPTALLDMDDDREEAVPAAAPARATKARKAKAVTGPLDDGPPARSLVEQVDDHARELRAQGSPLGDLLAERAEALAAEIRLVEASTVEQYRDRLSAMQDARADAAESRMASRCC